MQAPSRQAEEDTPKQENDIGYRIIKIPLGHCIHSDSTNVNYQNGNHSHYKQQRFRACHKGKSLVNPEFNEEQEVVVRGIGKIGSSIQPFVRNDLRIDDIVNNPFGIKARCRP